MVLYLFLSHCQYGEVTGRRNPGLPGAEFLVNEVAGVGGMGAQLVGHHGEGFFLNLLSEGGVQGRLEVVAVASAAGIDGRVSLPP